MNSIQTLDWDPYTSSWTVGGTGTINLPGGGVINIGGGESTFPGVIYPYPPGSNYPYPGGYPGVGGISGGMLLLILLGVGAFILLR